MFTGIIAGLGLILFKRLFNGQARFRVKFLFKITDFIKGESIAVNGVCVTVENFGHDWFEFYASTETLALTNLGFLQAQNKVNLERALLIGDRLSGHFVTGHIDTLATIEKITPHSQSKIIRIKFPHEFGKFIASKGSITLDGISLTVNQCGADYCEVNIIPATLEATTISTWRVGDKINMETDILAKYTCHCGKTIK